MKYLQGTGTTVRTPYSIYLLVRNVRMYVCTYVRMYSTVLGELISNTITVHQYASYRLVPHRHLRLSLHVTLSSPSITFKSRCHAQK